MALLLTLLVWGTSSRRSESVAANRFLLQSNEVSSLVTARMVNYEQVLRGLKGLFLASEYVDKEEFSKYHDALNLQQEYPGILGLAFAPKVEPANMASHYGVAGREGIEGYQIRPAGERDIYAPVFYVQPLGINSQRIVGYDMYSHPVRRQAMDRAWQTGLPSLTGRIALAPTVFEEELTSTLLFLAIYEEDFTPELEDIKTLMGWVVAPFEMSELLENIVLNTLNGVDVSIFDGQITDPAALLYASNKDYVDSSPPEFERKVVLDISGSPWTVVTRSNSDFNLSGDNEPVRVLVVGVFLSFVLAAFVWVLASSRNSALRKAAFMTKEIRETEFRWKAALAGAGDGVWDLNNETNELTYSEQWMGILGYKPGDISNQLSDWAKLVHPNDLLSATADMQACTEGTVTTLNHEIRLKTALGAYKWVLFRGAVVRWGEDGRALRTIGTIADIQAQKNIELALVESDRRFRGAFETAAIGMALVGLDGNWVQVNSALADMLGYSSDEVLDKTFNDITHPADIPLDVEEVAKLLAGEIDHYHMEKRYFRKDGTLIFVLLSVSLVRDSIDEPVHFVYQMEDITERRQLQNLVEHQATHDELTGLPNRRLLYDRLIHNLAQSCRHKRLMGVMFVDIDHFKRINDTHGHDVGDDVLCEVADRLRSCIRLSDTLARQGGDEFVVLMSEISKAEETHRLATAMLDAVSKPLRVNALDLPITLSIGVAIFDPESGDSHEALLRKADEALYEVKRTGRNGFHVAAQ
jgi:diguanylate cyclase (GGDEF)-like protein/PAS domain S-box-containing protein